MSACKITFKKNSGSKFVDTRFVKTCDEHVIDLKKMFRVQEGLRFYFYSTTTAIARGSILMSACKITLLRRGLNGLEAWPRGLARAPRRPNAGHQAQATVAWTGL